MPGKTSISWTEATWNPVVGCSVTSPGCTNCYAMTQAVRIQRMTPGSHYLGTTRDSKAGAVWSGKLVLAPEHILLAPLRWRKPRTIFVNSMGDLFHEDVPDAWIDQVFAVMILAAQHTYQVLTKRSARMRAYFARDEDGFMAAEARVEHYAKRFARERGSPIPVGKTLLGTAPWPHVWLGVSAEDQRRADERVPDLLETPAAIRFVSAEPLLGPIDFHRIDCGYVEGVVLGETREEDRREMFRMERDALFDTGDDDRPPLDWIIVGGESGPDARPMHPAWARSIRDQCAAAGVAFHFKQWGEWLPGQNDPHLACRDMPPGRDRVAHWQDGGWGARDCKGPPERNYVMWTPEGEMRRGGSRSGVDPFPVAAWASRVGKVAAGRLLDGVEHNGIPRSEAA